MRSPRAAEETAPPHAWRVASEPLPAWPLLTLLYGFPGPVDHGCDLFAPIACAGIMIAFLLLRGEIRTAPGVLIWACLLVWIAVCGLSLAGVLQAVGYMQRFVDLIAIGVALLYYVNARQSITPLMILRGFCVIWCSVVVLGWLAIFFPRGADRHSGGVRRARLPAGERACSRSRSAAAGRGAGAVGR